MSSLWQRKVHKKMNLNSSTAMIDADFINHLLETKILDDEIVENLKKSFEDYNISGAIHQLVYENELFHNNKINLLLNKKILQKALLEDIHNDQASRKSYYVVIIRELFKTLNSSLQLPEDDEQIFSYWISGKSLGEMHSLAACALCDCSMFLSDDAGSKRFANTIKEKFGTSIKVLERSEFFEGSNISRSYKHKLAHK